MAPSSRQTFQSYDPFHLYSQIAYKLTLLQPILHTNQHSTTFSNMPQVSQFSSIMLRQVQANTDKKVVILEIKQDKIWDKMDG